MNQTIFVYDSLKRAVYTDHLLINRATFVDVYDSLKRTVCKNHL